jgi:hypothetical protein
VRAGLIAYFTKYAALTAFELEQKYEKYSEKIVPLARKTAISLALK